MNKENNLVSRNDESIRVAGAIMRMAGILGVLFEIIVIYMPFNAIFALLYILEIEFNKLYMVIALAISLLFYILYLFTSYKMFGGTFTQRDFKLMILQTNGDRLRSVDVLRRIIVKFVTILFLLGVGAGMSFALFNHYAVEDFQLSSFVWSTVFFSILVSPILLISFFSSRTQTLTDFFSKTRVLVDYGLIQEEEREHLNSIIENPTLLLAGASTIPFWGLLIMVLIAFLYKLSGKKF